AGANCCRPPPRLDSRNAEDDEDRPDIRLAGASPVRPRGGREAGVSAPATSPRREGQVFQGESLAARYASFVKLPHTLFALPFAGTGAVLATYAHADRLRATTLLWILVAFT